MRDGARGFKRRFSDWGALYTDFVVKGQPSRQLCSLSFGSRLSFTASPAVWNRDRHAERRPRLIARQRIASCIRRWFEAQGFVEVDPPALQPSPGNETHLIGFATNLERPDGLSSAAYLHTSPEFAMKKLLTAGETRIFSLSHVFRNRERTALHAPEFTMLEWYRVGAPLTRLMDDCAALVALAAYALDAKAFAFRGREANPFEPPERLTVREAFSPPRRRRSLRQPVASRRAQPGDSRSSEGGRRPQGRGGRHMVRHVQPSSQ